MSDTACHCAPLALCCLHSPRACSEGSAGSPAVKCCWHDLVVHLQKLQFCLTDCLWITPEWQSASQTKNAYLSSLSPSMGRVTLPSVRLFKNLNANWCSALHGEENTKCWYCFMLFHFSDRTIQIKSLGFYFCFRLQYEEKINCGEKKHSLHSELNWWTWEEAQDVANVLSLKMSCY